MSLPSVPSILRATPPKTTYINIQRRNATLLRRPKRPYTFTQLITLTDGSTFQHRTTSPMPVYRTTRDSRNAPMWNPSSPKLVNYEVDEAGRLAAFRAKFGRSFDANTPAEEAEEGEEGREERERREREDQEEEDNLLDLISGFGQGEQHLQHQQIKSSGKKGRK